MMAKKGIDKVGNLDISNDKYTLNGLDRSFKGNLTISNALSLIRLMLVPVISLLILYNINSYALAFFLASIFTDFLDGYLARKRGEVTWFGKVIDPISDKLIFGSVIFSVLYKEQLYAWLYVFLAVALILVIGYVIFVKKKLDVSNVGRGILVAEVLIMCIMIYGIVDYILLVLLLILFLAAPLYYIFRYYVLSDHVSKDNISRRASKKGGR